MCALNLCNWLHYDTDHNRYILVGFVFKFFIVNCSLSIMSLNPDNGTISKVNAYCKNQTTSLTSSLQNQIIVCNSLQRGHPA
uniref:Uncharacterized protein n=1 Tax=Anguilla anguilla TaxID=7936 RepID=A0A0E9TVZ1_ANGAN